MMYGQQTKEEEVTEVVKPQKDDYQPADWAVGEGVATTEVADVSISLLSECMTMMLNLNLVFFSLCRLEY